ncbi:MAG: ComEC/Rec2 family competence protein [Planctomycetia bacterium]|nr:ComEC/Rec2 family competence protein [Planctomycetia bacterium]
MVSSTYAPIAAPLLPVAGAVTLGILLERYFPLPSITLIALLVGLLASALWARLRHSPIMTLLLWCVAVALTACWYRVQYQWPAEAIGHHALMDRVPVKLRGVVAEDVEFHLPRRPELLSGQGTMGYSLFLLRVHELQLTDRWLPVTGIVRVTVEGELKKFSVGDGVEVLGSLLAFSPPVNPGGSDFRQRWFDQKIQAALLVKTVDGIHPHPASSRWSIASIMAKARSWVRQSLKTSLPAQQAGIAQALLCGEQAALSPDQFESFLHTGVYHVLAVSGQHLVILGAFVGLLLRLTGLDMRHRSVWLAVMVLFYVFLTGARPPVVRAAIMVLTWCMALWLRRKANPINSLAFAWIAVAVIQPADILNVGCQLSFLAVFVLMQMVSPLYRWVRENRSPLDQLAVELKPFWWRLLHACWEVIRWSLWASFIVWLCALPLVLAQFHLISPVAVILGPILIIPITVALISGFLLVLLQSIPLVSDVFAWLAETSLRFSDWCVALARELPYSFGYWPDVPNWWVAGFYLILIPALLWPGRERWWKWFATAATVWLLMLVMLTQPDITQDLRVTVLSVGHGTCVVMETPTGKCLVYDVGSLAGPEIALRHLSNYLWYRGRTKIDELFLSHADLDHFNALPDLLERFRIGQIRMTPTFGEKPDRGTRATLEQIQRKHVSLSTLRRGDILEDGELEIEVLHPPSKGPEGIENVRSMVLLVTYQGTRLLLTGDLEQEGLEQVMQSSIERVDVLVAPHHGSRVSNTSRFAAWCRPKLVISSETFPRGPKPDPYAPLGGTMWRTWIHGGVTVQMADEKIAARTHLTKQVWP